MKVSIITPCYNAAPYIQRTITSVQAQTISDWEMIIVDDGSTDNSVSIVQAIAAKDSRIRIIQKPNGGTASARNKGLECAQGEYIQFLDADDEVAADKFEKQIAIMEAMHLDVSYTDYRNFNADGSMEEIQGLEESLFHLLLGWGVWGTLPMHCYLYAHKFIQSNKLAFSTTIHEREDWDWHIKVFTAHPKTKRLKDYCGALYFKSPTGKTSDGNVQKVYRGTCRFLYYRIQNSHNLGISLALLVRLSLELLTMALQATRYHIKDMFHIKNTFHGIYGVLTIICAILLLPISIPIYVGAFIYNHHIISSSQNK